MFSLSLLIIHFSHLNDFKQFFFHLFSHSIVHANNFHFFGFYYFSRLKNDWIFHLLHKSVLIRWLSFLHQFRFLCVFTQLFSSLHSALDIDIAHVDVNWRKSLFIWFHFPFVVAVVACSIFFFPVFFSLLFHVNSNCEGCLVQILFHFFFSTPCLCLSMLIDFDVENVEQERTEKHTKNSFLLFYCAGCEGTMSMSIFIYSGDDDENFQFLYANFIIILISLFFNVSSLFYSNSKSS